METVKIGVFVKDRDYRNALLRALSHESRDFQFVDLSGQAEVRGPGRCQIILEDREQEQDRDAAVIHLTYHEMYDMSATDSRMEIFRYEDARIFIGKIIYYYARMKGIDLYFHGKRKCRKVVFSSSYGGCGTTSAAMTSARFLKYRFGKRALFVSLCPVDGSRRFIGAGDGGNMLSLLYHLNTGDDIPLCKFISSSEGVDHFRGLASNRAAAEMTSTELRRLIRLIDEMGSYDYVFFDLGNHLGSLARFLIERADVSVNVRPRGSKETGEIPFRESGDTGTVIQVTDFDRVDEGAQEESRNVSLTYDPAAFVEEKERTYIDIRGRYGRDVARLAEKIIGCAEQWG